MVSLVRQFPHIFHTHFTHISHAFEVTYLRPVLTCHSQCRLHVFVFAARAQVYWHARTSPEVIHTEPTPECPRRKRKRMENKSK